MGLWRLLPHPHPAKYALTNSTHKSTPGDLALEINKNSVVKTVCRILFDPIQKTTDNNAFESIKCCFMTSERNEKGIKCGLLVKQTVL